jgi:large subunit ribosomal protein L23
MEKEQIIIEPVLTEKSNTQRESKKYVFKVNQNANKIQIMNAIKALYSVHPVKCNIVNVKPKPKRQRSRIGMTAAWKKAIVTIKKDENITIFEGAS